MYLEICEWGAGIAGGSCVWERGGGREGWGGCRRGEGGEWNWQDVEQKKESAFICEIKSQIAHSSLRQVLLRE